MCTRFRCALFWFADIHDDVIKWKHFPLYWPFVRGIHRSPVNSLHKGQWHGALMYCLICAWINGWVNSREAGDLRRIPAYYDVNVMIIPNRIMSFICSYSSGLLWQSYISGGTLEDMHKCTTKQLMTTSWNGNIFCVTGPLQGNLPVTGRFPSQRPVMRSFDVFSDLCLNKRLSKQSRRRWFQTHWLWRHCNDLTKREPCTFRRMYYLWKPKIST